MNKWQLKVLLATTLLLTVIQVGDAVRGIFWGSKDPSYAIVELGIDMSRDEGAVRCRLLADSTRVKQYLKDAQCTEVNRNLHKLSSDLSIAEQQLVTGYVGPCLVFETNEFLGTYGVHRSQIVRVDVPVDLDNKGADTTSFRLLCSSKAGAEKLSDFWFAHTDGGNPSQLQVAMSRDGFVFEGVVTNVDFTVKVAKARAESRVELKKRDSSVYGTHTERLLSGLRYSVHVFAQMKTDQTAASQDVAAEDGVVAVIPDDADGKIIPKSVGTKAQGRDRFWFGTLDIVPPLSRMHIGKGMYRTIQHDAGRLPTVLHDGVGDTLNDYYKRMDRDRGDSEDESMKVSPERQMAQLVSHYASKELELKSSLRSARLPMPLRFLVSRISKATVSVGDRILQAAKVVTPVNLGLVTEHIHWIVGIMEVLGNLEWAEVSLRRAYSRVGQEIPDSLSPDVEDSIWLSFQNRVFNAVMGVDDWIPSSDPVVLAPGGST